MTNKTKANTIKLIISSMNTITHNSIKEKTQFLIPSSTFTSSKLLQKYTYQIFDNFFSDSKIQKFTFVVVVDLEKPQSLNESLQVQISKINETVIDFLTQANPQTSNAILNLQSKITAKNKEITNYYLEQQDIADNKLIDYPQGSA